MARKTLWVVVCGLFLAQGSAFGLGPRGGWTMVGGLGLTASPDAFLIQPQFEYRKSARLYYGPMVQAGLGSGFTLFTMSGYARYELGNHRKFKPSLEGSLGLTVGGGQVGVHIGVGMGFDYKIDNTLSIGTMIRGNFAPPVDTFFLSWPIFLVRFVV